MKSSYCLYNENSYDGKMALIYIYKNTLDI